MESSLAMLAFVRAVECNGFTPAAHDLGVTPSAVSKLVTRLERRLGVRLLQRSTRRLALTAEGEIYFERVQRIVGEIADAESDVMRFGEQPRGRVRMSLGTAFATYALVPALPEFMARYPEITLDLVVTEYAVDLVEAGIDLAIRVGPLGDVNLAARRIGDLERVISAAPAYLEKHGVPRKPEDLARHNCLTLPGIAGPGRVAVSRTGRRALGGRQGQHHRQQRRDHVRARTAGTGRHTPVRHHRRAGDPQRSAGADPGRRAPAGAAAAARGLYAHPAPAAEGRRGHPVPGGEVRLGALAPAAPRREAAGQQIHGDKPPRAR